MENVEKFMKVELYIDSTKQEQVNALSELLNTIGKNEEAKQKERKYNKRQTDTPDPAPQPKKEDSTPGPGAPADEVKTYTIEEVREKLKEKVSEHREEIKAKLGELGAPNISNLDPEKYTEFMDFLNSLG